MANLYSDIPNVDRMSAILDAVTLHPAGISASELRGVTQMPKTTLYRLITSMAGHGFLTFHASTNLYTLGTRFLFSPVSSGQWDAGLRNAAAPLMQSLALQTQETIKLNTFTGILNHTIVTVEGPKPIRISVDLGAMFPLHAGASGKILMQNFTLDDIRRYFSLNRNAYTPKTITTPQQMMDELKQVRQQGYAIDLGELLPEIYAIAVPVYYAGMVVAALSVTYPSILHHNISVPHYVELLQKTSDEITTAFKPDQNNVALPNVTISDDSK